jgi:Kdo2-lipid IVA lauroyltransferase/acyltransferase
MGRDTQYDQFKKNKSSSLKWFRHEVEYYALISISKLASWFSISKNQKFGALIGLLAMKLAAKDRGIAEYQIDFCFPEMSSEQKNKLVADVFRNLGTTFFEVLILKKIKSHARQWIKFKNEEIVHESLKEGKGLVLMFGHVGNWELYSIIYEMLGIKGMTIAGAVGDSKLDRLLLSSRDSVNVKTVHRGDKKSPLSIIRCFRNNEVFLFAMDQDTKVQTIFVDFFGKKAATAVGAAKFAQKFKAPVVSGFGARMPDGTHLYSFELLSKQPYQEDEKELVDLTTRYNQALENHIRKYPEQWVWFHRRWKTQPDEQPGTDKKPD